MKSVEVEKKFIPSAQFEQEVLNSGGHFLGCTTIQDKYYDLQRNNLVLHDYWLRKRDNKWQLKCAIDCSETATAQTPNKPPANAMPSYTSTYQEITDEFEILQRIRKIFNVEVMGTQPSVDGFIKEHDLVVFAEFETKRTKYELDEVIIDIDKTSFGYNIGELEVMTSSDALEIDDGVKRINDVACILGE